MTSVRANAPKPVITTPAERQAKVLSFRPTSVSQGPNGGFVIQGTSSHGKPATITLGNPSTITCDGQTRSLTGKELVKLAEKLNHLDSSVDTAQAANFARTQGQYIIVATGAIQNANSRDTFTP